jgi:RNA polymerase sigma-70 factor (ECF subfamily)
LAAEVHDLVERARGRDAEAFEALIGHFERTALAVAYAQLHDAHRAGDAVQEAFLRAWQELPRLQDVQRFAGWLMQIVRNAAIDIRRRVKPCVAEFPDLTAREVTPAEATERNDTARRIQAALATLDETTRTAVTMRYYDGMSSKEIAEVLSMSPPAIDMRLSRARSQLKDLLAPLVDGREAAMRPAARPAGELA